MARYLFDCETNGFLDVLDRLHCLVLKDIDTRQVYSCSDHKPDGSGLFDVEVAVRMLQDADLIIGHNVIKFDVPAIKKVYPWFKPRGLIRDTMVLTRAFFPEVKKSDAALMAAGKLPRTLFGKHTLEAWGYRLGVMKGVYQGGFETWNEEMQLYCEQDVEVTEAIRNRLRPFARYDRSITLEHEAAEVCAQIERNGFGFDEAKAAELYAQIAGEKARLEAQLQEVFPPVRNKKLKKKVAYIPFNPSSRIQIAQRLTEKYGWEPVEFTDGGQAKVDETVLGQLPYPEAKLLAEYMLLGKRCGQIAEGDEAWLKVAKQGRIHGGINPCGAVTTRATHSHPNMTQVPKVGSRFGKECRELFVP